jgi:integrase
MSDVGVFKAMRTLGIRQDEQTGHGWRATARTLLDEELKFPPHLIEHQLAHASAIPTGAPTTAPAFCPSAG